jgi:hypothetical protein
MTQISDILQGAQPDPDELYANFKPVRYRYVMTYLHDEVEQTPFGDVLHQPGEVLAILAMTQVSYSVGMYAGTEMSGTVNLPEQTLDEMPHPPLNDFDRWVHPDVTGVPVGSMFECGNRAIYIMRNEEVVWGGILWTRSYSSGTPQLQITALSWEGYLYYRLVRQTVTFNTPTNMYLVWYALVVQTLTDFNWFGPTNGLLAAEVSTLVADAVYGPRPPRPKPDPHKKHGDPYWTPYDPAEYPDTPGHRPPRPDAPLLVPAQYALVPWTGITRLNHFNAPARPQQEAWPGNSPRIELPDQGLRLRVNGAEVLTQKTWRGYDMLMAGSALEEWADTDTVASDENAEEGGGKTRMEYRVVCWFDSAQQRFRQRYIVGTMSYPAGQDPNDPYPDAITNPLLGKNTQNAARGPNNQLVFDYPGSISEWSLAEGMDEAATRILVTDDGEAAAKHCEYGWDKALLNVPAYDGSQGWLLYDKNVSWGNSNPVEMGQRADRLVQLFKVPQAAKITDPSAGLTGGDDYLITPSQGQRTSIRATQFDVTLYAEPSRPLPDFEVGDWAVFAIEDPFYGGKMYLFRRILGYTVTVVPEQESDYSHESIQLQLTDDSQIDLGT